MKLTLQMIDQGEDEITIHYHQMNQEISGIIQYINKNQIKIMGTGEDQTFFLSLHDILYFESVDTNIFAYTKDKILKISYTLTQLQLSLSESGFFRCSKSMIVNLYHIESLKSESGNRINASLSNKEHIMISRKYAKELRQLLRTKGGNADE